MSASIFEKIVTIVSKVVQILSYSIEVFFGESNGIAPPDS